MHYNSETTSLKIIVTAGPTIEPLDPVRYITNRSTGTMGYEIAAEGVRQGCAIDLISGPVAIAPPEGARLSITETAEEMKNAVDKAVQRADCIIMTAAVCDFRPERREKSKIKKKENLSLDLKKNPDILLGLKDRKDLVRVGFALETEDPIENGTKKLNEKELDLVIVNALSEKKSPFGEGEHDYVLIRPGGQIEEFNNCDKKELAKSIITIVRKIYDENKHKKD